MEFICDKKHTFWINWNKFSNRGQRCKVCTHNKKPTIDSIRDFMKKDNYILLSTEYKGSQKYLWVLCPKKHKYKVKWANYQQGKRCPVCAGNIRNSYNVVRDTIKHVFNYKLLTKTYNNAHEKIEIRCDNNHVFTTNYNKLQQGRRCPYCNRRYYTKEELKEFKIYRRFIVKLTSRNFTKYYYKINPKKLKRNSSNYHLDHIYTVSDGFKNNMPPEVIANPNNLQMLWWKDNIIKRDRSDQTKQELYLGYYKYELEK